MRDSKAKAVGLLHLAVLLFGLSGVIGRGVAVPAHYVAWGRSLCSSVILLAIMKLGKKPVKIANRRDLLLALAGGAVLAFHWTAFFLSVKTASVAIGTVTFSAFPIFTLILEPIVFKERLGKRNLLLAAVMTAGVIITVPEFSLSSSVLRGVLWGIASAASYAALALINRELSSKYFSIKICFYEQGTAAIVLLPFVLLSSQGWTGSDISGVMAIGVLCTALAYSLFVSAQRHVSAGAASLVSGMETVYGMILAALLLGEPPSMRALLGGAIILTAAAISSLGVAKKD